ncbi:MAG: PPC domain-containing protein [Candidatus Fimivicinus sp.]|nr:PPC domain-containing protein [Oscillospiraceae bacterium]MDY5590967.1 PPC domain-containing protein [Candidatus Fimivicinus sp.]
MNDSITLIFTIVGIVVAVTAILIPIWHKIKSKDLSEKEEKRLFRKVIYITIGVTIGAFVIASLCIFWPSKAPDDSPDISENSVFQNAKSSETVGTIIGETDKEIEPNDSALQANLISVNAEIKGRLQTEEDVDYYKISLQKKGSICISFGHQKIDSNDTFWKVSLLDNSEEMVLEEDIVGGVVQSESNKARISSGDYYLKVEKYYYSDLEYTIKVNFTEEDDSFENEPNDEIASANPIELNSKMTGNIQHEDDTDYYKFTLTELGSVHISFEHAKIDSNDSFWRISLLSETSADPIIESSVRGSESISQLSKARLPIGTYYIKVNKYQFSNIDYHINLNYQKEGNSYEVEPNNDILNANKIEVNKKIIGNIQREDDVDYFTFTVNQNGTLSIEFNHPKIDSDDTHWRIYLLDNTDTAKIEQAIIGSMVKTASDRIRVSAGTYYVKIDKRFNYSNLDYNFTVKFE